MFWWLVEASAYMAYRVYQLRHGLPLFSRSNGKDNADFVEYREFKATLAVQLIELHTSRQVALHPQRQFGCICRGILQAPEGKRGTCKLPGCTKKVTT